MSTKVWACNSENIKINKKIMPGNQTAKAEECIIVQSDENDFIRNNH